VRLRVEAKTANYVNNETAIYHMYNKIRQSAIELSTLFSPCEPGSQGTRYSIKHVTTQTRNSPDSVVTAWSNVSYFVTVIDRIKLSHVLTTNLIR
jgi:hypothetical protein